MGGKLYIQLSYFIDLTVTNNVLQPELVLNPVLLPIP